MPLFGTANTLLLQAGQSPGLALMMFLVMADYIAGDVTFQCPCDVTKMKWTSAQQFYAVSFLFCPGLIIFVVDTRWSLCHAWRSCNNRCVMLYRPLILCITWIFFFMASKRFAHCFEQTYECKCTDEEKRHGCTPDAKSYEAYVQLAVASMLWAILLVAFWATGACSCKSKCACAEGGIEMHGKGLTVKKKDLADTLEELDKNGICPSTAVTLYEQGLLYQPPDQHLLLFGVQDKEMRSLPVSVGQMELIRQYREKERRFAANSPPSYGSLQRSVSSHH